MNEEILINKIWIWIFIHLFINTFYINNQVLKEVNPCDKYIYPNDFFLRNEEPLIWSKIQILSCFFLKPSYIGMNKLGSLKLIHATKYFSLFNEFFCDEWGALNLIDDTFMPQQVWILYNLKCLSNQRLT